LKRYDEITGNIYAAPFTSAFWAEWRFGRSGYRHNPDIIRIALAGNPNSGKTSIFNALTGQRQHIGNYPGVTVEKKSGMIHFNGKIVEFIDLPGTYSLSAYSMEEIVSRDFVLNEKPDVGF